jgi:hypothetical protein
MFHKGTPQAGTTEDKYAYVDPELIPFLKIQASTVISPGGHVASGLNCYAIFAYDRDGGGRECDAAHEAVTNEMASS